MVYKFCANNFSMQEKLEKKKVNFLIPNQFLKIQFSGI